MRVALHAFEHFGLHLGSAAFSNKTRSESSVKSSQEGYWRSAGKTDSTFEKHMARKADAVPDCPGQPLGGWCEPSG